MISPGRTARWPPPTIPAWLVVWCSAEGARADQRPLALEQAGDRVDPRHLERLGRRQRRQDAGQGARDQRLAGPGRPDQQQGVAAGGRGVERPLDRRLAADVAEVAQAVPAAPGRLAGGRRPGVRRARRLGRDVAAQPVDQVGQDRGRHDLDAAETRLLAESLAIRCELGDRLAPADMLVFQGDMAYRRGELARARSLFEEGLGLNRALGNEQGVAGVLAAPSGLAWDEGDYALARSLREESVSVNRTLGDQAGIAWMLLELGRIVLRQDDLPSAHACFRESLLVARALEFPWGILHTLEGLAEAAVREGKVERAARLSGAAAAIRNGMHVWGVPGGRVRSGRQLGPGRHHVGADTAAAAWAEGQAMTLEQAIAYALEEDGPSL